MPGSGPARRLSTTRQTPFYHPLWNSQSGSPTDTRRGGWAERVVSRVAAVRQLPCTATPRYDRQPGVGKEGPPGRGPAGGSTARERDLAKSVRHRTRCRRRRPVRPGTIGPAWAGCRPPPVGGVGRRGGHRPARAATAAAVRSRLATTSVSPCLIAVGDTVGRSPEVRQRLFRPGSGSGSPWQWVRDNPRGTRHDHADVDSHGQAADPPASIGGIIWNAVSVSPPNV